MNYVSGTQRNFVKRRTINTRRRSETKEQSRKYKKIHFFSLLIAENQVLL